MTTKEQERKALAQIRSIVDSLGEGSYIATAFAGCFEDAEENITNDFAVSMKDRYEHAMREVEDCRKQYAVLCAEYQTEKAKLEKRLQEEQDNVTGLLEQIEDLEYLRNREREAKEAALKDVEKAQTELQNIRIAVEEARDAVRVKEAEIICLKAKLYDLLVK